MLAKRLVRLRTFGEMTTVRNIVLITPGFPQDEDDHLCMPYLMEFLKHLVQAHPDINVRVVSIHYPYQPKQYHWNGIEVEALGGNNNRFPARLMTWRKALKTLDRFHSESEIHAVHSLWLNECSYLAQRWTQKNNVKHIATAMGQDVLSGNRYLNRIKLDQLTTITVSNWQNERLKDSSGRPADEVIPWGLDSVKLENRDRDIDILGVGSFTKLKDYETFLKVVKSISEKRPSLKAVLIGYGPERENLEQLSDKMDLQNAIKFTGELPRPEVLDYMQRSKVLLHPSRYESQGYVFNEAMACGLGIVSREVGIAMASDRWIIADSDSEMAASALNLIDRKFESEAIQPLRKTVEAYLELY